MAVITRKRKRGVTYYVVTSVKGVKHWEHAGNVKRAAQELDAQRRREVKEGTYRPDGLTPSVTVGTFIAHWLETRRNRSAHNDRRLLELHVVPVKWFASLAMGDVRPKHVLKLIAEIRAAEKLAEKSISLVLDLVRVMFRDAVIGDVIEQSPYVVPRGELRRTGVKRTAYTGAEAARLLDRPTELAWLAWNHVALYGGLRCGEINGLQWGDWDDASKPLGALVVTRQYDGQPLKTERPRVVPVHPELRARLIIWREQWRAIQCREPGPSDLIFPGAGGSALSKSSAYKAWLRSCKVSEVVNRSVHSTRHTFITFARRGGAPVELVELITHNPKGTIIDRYTTRVWSELCGAVLAVTYVDVPVDGGSGTPGDDSSEAWTRTSGNLDNDEESSESGDSDRARGEHESSGPGVADARVDASQPAAAWALAFAAERVLRRAG